MDCDESFSDADHDSTKVEWKVNESDKHWWRKDKSDTKVEKIDVCTAKYTISARFKNARAFSKFLAFSMRNIAEEGILLEGGV